MRVKNILNNIFIKNFFNLTINQVVNIFVAIIATPILFQNLGESSFGLINYSFSIFMLLSIIISYGYHLNGPKKIAQNPCLSSNINFINDLISLRISIAFVISVIIILISFFTHIFDGYRFIILFSLPILFSEALNPIFYLQGKNNLSVVTLLNFFAKIIYLGFIVFFIKSSNDALMVNFIFGVSLVIPFIYFWVRTFLKNRIKFILSSFENLIFRLKENFEFFLSSVAGHISIHSGLIILKLFVNDIELGKFALANRIAIILRMIPVFVAQSVLQNAILLKRDNQRSLNDYLNYFFLRGLIGTFIIGLFFLVFSKWIIILFAGEEVLYSSNILSILSFIPFCAMLNFKNILIILINEKKKILNKSTWLSSIIMIILCIFLCKMFGGFGLAYALLFSEIFSFLIHSYFLNKTYED
jgi:O-antigen/teichoic acid export membrane protein